MLENAATNSKEAEIAKSATLEGSTQDPKSREFLKYIHLIAWTLAKMSVVILFWISCLPGTKPLWSTEVFRMVAGLRTEAHVLATVLLSANFEIKRLASNGFLAKMAAIRWSDGKIFSVGKIQSP